MESRIALVTGSASGIGLAAAQALRGAGFTVYASARRAESLEDLENKGFATVQLDVTDDASMQEAVQHIADQHGAVDVLVNNAGYGQNGPLEALAMDDIRRQFETNVFGLVRLCQLVLPGMRLKGWGRIINVGSVGGTFSTPGAGAYHASKFALEALSDSLRTEVKGFGVEVALIQPPGVYTEFNKKLPLTYPKVSPDDPYSFFIENHSRVARQIFEGRNTAGVVTAEQVAARVLQAATATNPRTRYKVGLSAHAFFRLRRWLPDRAWDRLMMAQFPMQPKGSRPAASEAGSERA